MITQENSCFTITATIESRPIRNAYGGYVASLRDSNSYQLKQILKLKHTGDSETLNVPVKGTLEKPKFELGRALADIAKIRAKEEAVKRLPDLAARIAQAALDELTKKAFAGPPPLDASVDPLPWEKPRR